MNKLIAILAGALISIFIAATYLYAKSQGLEILEPQGYISSHQRDLFVLAIVLGLIALAPVLIMTYIIIHRYHAGNSKADRRYRFTWEIKPEASWFWAAFVSLIITILAVIMVQSTVAVDPYSPIQSDKPTKVIRVVALPWKWLFIYPEENIATVNELAIPVDQPITFELTADAPMSSFWIPKLGGMIYTMEGMVTKLNLMATSPGQFEGKNAEINGKGYSGMKFTTKAMNDQEYQDWVQQVKQSPDNLDQHIYEGLAQQSINHPVQLFASADPTLYGSILSKFMSSDHQQHSSSGHHSAH